MVEADPYPVFRSRSFVLTGCSWFVTRRSCSDVRTSNFYVRGMTVQNGKNLSTLAVYTAPIKCVSYFTNSALIIKLLIETEAITVLCSYLFLKFSCVFVLLNINIKSTCIESSRADTTDSNLYRFLSRYRKIRPAQRNVFYCYTGN
jgi:hypothetical protein